MRVPEKEPALKCI